MESKILRELNSDLKFMRGVEKTIAEHILSDPRNFTGLSLKAFSFQTGASQGSIVNFAKKYVGGGFPVLKMEVASCIAIEDKKELALNGVGELKKSTFTSFEGVKVALDNTYALNEEEVFLSVVDKILRAKKIEVYGVHRSAVVATDFYFQLVQMGIPATFVSDVLNCAISASFLDKDSLFIAVSWSGATKDVIDAVKIAKDKNVPIICITGNKNSPLAKLSDDVLVAASSGSIERADTEDRLSQIALVGAICKIIAQKRKETVAINVEMVDKILNSHNVNE